MMTVVALLVFARIQVVSSSSFLHLIDTFGAKQRLFRGGYAPGLGTACYGVWTTAWTEHQGKLPPALEEELNVSARSLLDDVREHRCPYGVSLPGQVTFPQYGRHENVASLSVLLVIAVFYSYVPYLMAARAVLGAVMDYWSYERTIGTTHLYVLLWLLSAIVLQELIFKPIIKQPRPGELMQVKDYSGKYAGSCLQTCGMPSSHSMLAMGWFFILLVDRIYRVELFRTEPSVGATIKDFLKQLRSWEPFKTEALLPIEFAADMTFWGMLLLPVPIMRVLLFDHSTSQVLFGSIIGIIYAFSWWRFTRCCQRKYANREREILWQWPKRPQSESVAATNSGQPSGETNDDESPAATGSRQQSAEARPERQSSWILRIRHDLTLRVSTDEQGAAELKELAEEILKIEKEKLDLEEQLLEEQARSNVLLERLHEDKNLLEEMHRQEKEKMLQEKQRQEEERRKKENELEGKLLEEQSRSNVLLERLEEKHRQEKEQMLQETQRQEEEQRKKETEKLLEEQSRSNVLLERLQHSEDKNSFEEKHRQEKEKMPQGTQRQEEERRKKEAEQFLEEQSRSNVLLERFQHIGDKNSLEEKHRQEKEQMLQEKHRQEEEGLKKENEKLLEELIRSNVLLERLQHFEDLNSLEETHRQDNEQMLQEKHRQEEKRRKKKNELEEKQRQLQVQLEPMNQQAWEERLLGSWWTKSHNSMKLTFRIIAQNGYFYTKGDIGNFRIQTYERQSKVKFNGMDGDLKKKDGKDIIRFPTQEKTWEKSSYFSS